MRKRHLIVLVLFATMFFQSAVVAAENQLQNWMFLRGFGNPVTETVPFAAVEGPATVNPLSGGASSDKLMSHPRSQFAVEIVQAPVPPVSPETVLARTAAALRAGDISLVLKGFCQDEKL